MRTFRLFLIFVTSFGLNTLSAAETAPAWKLKNLSGQSVQLSDFTGKVVILDFWATWCIPCRQEIPNLIALQNGFGPSAIQVVGLSEDEPNLPMIQKFVETNKLNYPVLLADPATISAYQAQGLPTLVIIDQKGNIAARHVGPVSEEVLQAEVTALLPKGTTNTLPTKEELKKRLTAEQYAVTQEASTEPPFENAYWNNHAEGIYVDVITGRPLFCSKDKFDSDCGWPAFSKPISKDLLVQKSDDSFGMSRTEVRAAQDNSHLGHVFNDGPGPTGIRYCINSASLRFVPKEKMKEEGYGSYLVLFDGPK